MTETKLQPEYPDLDKYKYNNGDIYYYKKDTRILHNPYGPAIIDRDGGIYYFVEDNRHRLDGPATIYSDGQEEYWINYEYLTKEEFEKHPKRLKYLGKEYLICLI